jgi:hypothetical protein
MVGLVHPRFDVFQQRKGRTHFVLRQIKNGFRLAA